MRFNYTLTGTIEVPEGSTSPDGYCIQLPADENGNARVLKLWEAWELHTVTDSEENDDHRDVSFDELTDMDVHFDGDVATFTEADDD